MGKKRSEKAEKKREIAHWRKKYAAAKTCKEREVIAADLMQGIMLDINEIYDMKEPVSAEELGAVFLHKNAICEAVASVHSDYKPGWKLHKAWFQHLLSGVIGQSKTAMYYFAINGWEYGAKYDDNTTIETKLCWDYIKSEWQEVHMLLENTAFLKFGSVYQSTTGVKWTITTIEDGIAYVEAQDKNGKWMDDSYPVEYIHQRWERVA